MQETILIVYLVVSIALIGIILLQQGKGAEMGASFGAGGANTVFGAAGSGNVLTKTTTILAILFFATALSISYINSEAKIETDAVLDETTTTESEVAPSLEAELPTAASGLESETAPEKAKPVIEAVKAEATKVKETVKAESTTVEETDEKATKSEGKDE
jgi:preprotein translocase subunit SecG